MKTLTKKSKIKYTYIWGACILLIVTLCIFGFVTQTKGTKAADIYSLSGEWRWNDGDLISPDTMKMDWSFECTDCLLWYDRSYYIKDYELNYTDSAGAKYQSLALSWDYSNSFYVYYDTSYRPMESGNEYTSESGITPILSIRLISDKYYGDYMTEWVDPSEKSRYQTINFGSTRQNVTEEFYLWFLKNTEPVNKCYYNASESKFVWTNITETGVAYPEYNTKEKCGENATTEYKLSGKWMWNSSIGVPGNFEGVTHIDWSADDVQFKVINEGTSYKVKDYKLNFIDALGNKYQSLSFFNLDGYDYRVAYDTSYTAPISSNENNKKEYISENGIQEIIKVSTEVEVVESATSETEWLVDKEQYQTIDFGNEEQPVTKEFYIWFFQNARPIIKCYYEENKSDLSKSRFVWTNIIETGVEFPGYYSESQCINAKLSIILKNTSGGLTSEDINGIEYKLSPGIYKISAFGTKPTREGYIFNGWKLVGKNGEAVNYGKSYKSSDEIMLGTNDDYYLTFDTQWAETYEIVYDANGGKDSPSKQSGNESSIKLSQIIPTRTGYVFINWNDKKDGTGNSYVSGETYTGDANVTLYAQWGYEVIYDANDGTSKKGSDKVFANGQIKLPSANLENHVFVGWYTAKAGGTLVGTTSAKYTVTKNVTLYARYEKILSVDENKYKLDEENEIIIVGAGTSETEFKNDVDLYSEYVLNVSKKTVENKDVLYTGGKISILTQALVPVKEYTAVVNGDIDGNGKISMVDYVKIYNYIRNKYLSPSFDDTLKGAYAIAADYDGNGEVKMVDYVKIYNYIRNKHLNN